MMDKGNRGKVGGATKEQTVTKVGDMKRKKEGSKINRLQGGTRAK